jgi:hypothetical protein
MDVRDRFTASLFAKPSLTIIVLSLSLSSASIRMASAASTETAPTTPAAKTEAPENSDFPYTVKFEQGATQFADGDKITIHEIRGTTEAFEPGNIYVIKGMYTLNSHDRATLSAFTTAAESKDGTGPIWAVQTTKINRGTGTFTLFLPMSCRGWPHVSFYPADNGEGFGGNYFGTGDSTLRKWWGTKEIIDRVGTTAPPASSDGEH